MITKMEYNKMMKRFPHLTDEELQSCLEFSETCLESMRHITLTEAEIERRNAKARAIIQSLLAN